MAEMRTLFYKFRFDYDVGMLVKSPCRECLKYPQDFPKCIDECKMLDKIQQFLAEIRTCSKG